MHIEELDFTVLSQSPASWLARRAPPPFSRLPQVVDIFYFILSFVSALSSLFFVLLSPAVIGWRRQKADLRRPLLLSDSGSITPALRLDAARS